MRVFNLINVSTCITGIYGRSLLLFVECKLRPFTCPTCLKSYTRKSNLSRHQRIECGQEKKMVCPICEQRFYYRSEVKNHALNKHGIYLNQLDAIERQMQQ
ncbi:Drought induced 19 protein (Di19), zinc-binding [Popillia japonica]|uniref:Drought induced 19 protein (Di19), zinc-binding n=1 Tax=Popillia japonica TaxID=7064 RepID=A0AAW1L7E7_POPJA